MNIEARIAEIETRRLEIRTALEGTGEVDVQALQQELTELNDERTQLEARRALAQSLNHGGGNPIPSPEQNRQRSGEETEREYRSAWLRHLMGRQLTDAEERAYSSADNSAGAVIPTQTANKITQKMYAVAPILKLCNIFRIPGNVKIPIEGTTTDAALHAENAAITADADTLTYLNLTGYEVTKLIKASKTVETMSVDAFEDYIVKIVAETVARKLENYVFTGTGNNQPGGICIGGKGANGAFTNNTDMLTVAAANDVTEANIITLYSMLGDGYENGAVWTMSKSTFFAYFHAIMNTGKNNTISFMDGKYYILGNEVVFTSSLVKGVAYFGNFNYEIINFAQDIKVEKSLVSGFASNSIDYLGSCIVDAKPAAGLGAFVKFVKTQA